ncbi:gastrin-releasing peptide [Microcaecilia unicolor]|uniref:Gastrin-releasing peptide n=1 Tax=Microcaecilia unicolor TaxID=1415580 RepID=A0A6P7X3J4_9AMPH|nr:gastrin-releasing peptide [Microcaecilia unicolor]
MAGTLPCRRVRSLLTLVLCTLVLFKVHLGRASPSQQQLQGEEALLSRIYPRGSHWAVGHLMGKKSTDELPDIYEGADTIPSSKFPENFKQLEGVKQLKLLLKNLFDFTDENKSAQALRETLPLYNRKWETEDNSLKEMADYLLQILNRKENTPS